MNDQNPNSASHGNAESELHAYAWSGHVDRVRHLLSNGADPNWRDSIGESALFGAAGWGHEDVVRLLLEHGARHDFAASAGWTALHWAARADLGTVEALVDAGAEVSAATQSGELPIDTAHYYGKGEIVRYLKTVGPQIASRR